ncbi:pickpocket protein 28-like [Zophobas morio]|uniref:pickpocket protein 28-like n=1 Tax=Zophobas morio TaxID=2755281 RepID=UPI003082C6A4
MNNKEVVETNSVEPLTPYSKPRVQLKGAIDSEAAASKKSNSPTASTNVEEIDRNRSYFQERIVLYLNDLERAEVLRRVEAQKKREHETDFEGRYYKLRKHAVHFIYNSDVHGIRYLGEKRTTCEKIFWGWVVCLSLITCAILIVWVIIQFGLSSPIILSYNSNDIDNAVLYNVFPSVTICPENKFVYNAFTPEEIQNMLVNQTVPPGKSLTLAQYIVLLCAEEKKDWNFGSTILHDDFFELIDQIYQPLDEIFLTCDIFGTRHKCSELFFPTLTDVGICYTFNMRTREDFFTSEVYNHRNFYKSKPTMGWTEDDKPLRLDTYPNRALLFGNHNGLRVVLKANKLQETFKCKSVYTGFKVIIHRPIDIPHPSKYYFLVPRNKFVTVVVDLHKIATHERVLKMPPSYRKCYRPYEKPLKYFTQYTNKNCYLECRTEMMLKRCNCTEFYMPRKKNTPICGADNIVCAKRSRDELRILESQASYQKKETTYCDCLPRCTSYLYLNSFTEGTWNWKDYYENQWYETFFNETGGFNTTTDELSLLTIYFKKPFFISVIRNEWGGIPELISNIGGFSSFFTGMSMVSGVELIYFFTIRLLCNKIKYGMWLKY